LIYQQFVLLPKSCHLGFSFTIARRVAFNQQRSFSRFIIRLSIAATGVSVAAMILTLAFVNGFQQTVADKVFSFWGHIRVQQYEAGKSLIAEETAITTDSSIENLIRQQPGVVTVQEFATKSAVLEANQEIEGVLLKGIDARYDSTRLIPYLQQGRWLSFNDSSYSKEILVSASQAAKMGLQVHDTIRVHFVSSLDDSKTYRKLVIAGIYKTGIEEYDQLFMLGDIRLIRRINDWNDDQSGGYEVFVNDYHQTTPISQELSNALPVQWVSRSIQEIYPNIFDWLNIQDVNRNVIFIVMAAVAIINLVTCLLILILERTRMIGLLKALGADNWTIQRVFIYHASVITLLGIGIGSFIGLGVCFLQQATGFIRLDEAAYYVAEAPMHIIWWQVIAVCLGTAIICYAALLLPSVIIRKISPVKAIAFR
jgi:lipoprotein-releasing system permease protein